MAKLIAQLLLYLLNAAVLLLRSTTSCRFDMMHIMIDEPDDDMDMLIATHIVKVHQRRERAFNVPYTMPQVQRYIKYARSIRPQMNIEVLPKPTMAGHLTCSTDVLGLL